MTDPITDPVVKTIDVPCSAAEAFDVFVHHTSSWWPLSKHAVSAGAGKVAQAVTIEPQKGGAVYETMHDGTRSEWGQVLEYDPGRRLAMSWHPGTPEETATEVVVVFSAKPEGGCRVELTHSNWQAWGERASEMRGNYDGGWVHVFEECYAAQCRQA